MIKAVIFDLDDTLVNTWPWHSAGLNAALQKHGHSLAELPAGELRLIVGQRTRDVLAWLRRRFHISASVEELSDIRRPVFEKLRADGQTLFPGAREVLEKLHSAGFRLALVSSGREQYVNSVLDRWKITKYFDDVLGGDEVTRGKPDPEPYRHATEVLKIPPAECVVIEDAEVGIESAKAAGCFCLAVRNSNIPPQNYSKADMVVNELREIKIGKL